MKVVFLTPNNNPQYIDIGGLNIEYNRLRVYPDNAAGKDAARYRHHTGTDYGGTQGKI